MVQNHKDFPDSIDEFLHHDFFLFPLLEATAENSDVLEAITVNSDETEPIKEQLTEENASTESLQDSKGR